MTDAVVLNGRETIAAGSKSFALASRLFATELRNPVTELYAWCRYCDDAIDGQLLGHNQVVPSRRAQEDALEQLYARTELALAGEPDNDPVFQGLARVVRTHDIDARYPRELLHGFEMDVHQRVYRDEADLLEYCYHVAGVVGVMMARIMGVDDEPTLDRACDLGLAFQITNIARDVVEDAHVGRVYLPINLLYKHGLVRDCGTSATAQALTQPENWPQLHRAVMELLNVSNSYYRSANQGLVQLPFRCGWAVNAALKVYRDIGTQLQQRGPDAWARRVSTSHTRKLWLTACALPIGSGCEREPRPSELYCRPSR